MFLLVVAYAKSPPIAILFLTIAVGFSGFAISGKFKYFHSEKKKHFFNII